VRLISDRSLEFSTLKEIRVAEDNPYFTSVDGVLFTKNMTTLVKYPAAKELTQYTIPDSTLHVAYGGMYYLTSLLRIDVGKNLRSFGVTSFGYAYPDSPEDSSKYVYESDLTNVKNTMPIFGTVVIDPDNPNFVSQ
jgi:hypothetical protein